MSESEFERKYDQLEAMRQGALQKQADAELALLLQLSQFLEEEATPSVMPRAHEFRNAVASKVRRRPIWRPLLGIAAGIFVAAVLGWQLKPIKVVNTSLVMDHELLENAMEEQSRELVLEYLENSEQLLLTMRDHDLKCSDESLDFQPEKNLAKQLLIQQKILSPGMNNPEFTQVRHVFTELEQVLVDVNMMDPCSDPSEVNMINEQVLQERLLSKIRLVAQEIQYS